MKKIFLCLCLILPLGCKTPPPQVNEDPTPLCQNEEKVPTCIQSLRDLSEANDWAEFETRYEQLCRQGRVFCERRSVSGQESADSFELEQPGDALFKRPKEKGLFDIYFIRSAPGSEKE